LGSQYASLSVAWSVTSWQVYFSRRGLTRLSFAMPTHHLRLLPLLSPHTSNSASTRSNGTQGATQLRPIPHQSLLPVALPFRSHEVAPVIRLRDHSTDRQSQCYPARIPLDSHFDEVCKCAFARHDAIKQDLILAKRTPLVFRKTTIVNRA
jgi:hypothetical protein